MGGFFSETTRDVIALIGLALAILQTVLAFKALNAATGDTRGRPGRDQTRKPLHSLVLESLLSTSGGETRGSLVKFIGCLCVVGAITWLLTYATPVPANPEPASLIQIILLMGGVVCATAEYIYFGFFFGAIRKWLEKNGAQEREIGNLAAFFLSLAAGLVSLCVLTLWFTDGSGWVGKFMDFQVFGIVIIGMVVICVITGGIIEEPGRIIKEIKARIKSARKRVI